MKTAELRQRGGARGPLGRRKLLLRQEAGHCRRCVARTQLERQRLAPVHPCARARDHRAVDRLP